MIRAVVFDMDGVLIDSEQFYTRRRADYLKSQGIEITSVPDLSGYCDQKIWEAFVPDDADRRESLRRGYLAYQKDHPTPFAELLNPGARSVMEQLRALGMRVAIASSSPRKNIESLMAAAGFADMVDFFMSGYECAEFKPAPDIYLRVMGALGVGPHETLVIEDSPTGIHAGVAAGARVLALRPKRGASIDQSAADATIGELEEILDHLV